MTVAARAGSSPRWAVPSPVRQFVPVALFIAVATATVAIVDERPDIARAGDSAAALAGELAAGALLVAAALAAKAWRPRPRFTGPLTAAGIGWLLFEWNSPGAGPAFTAGLVLYAAWPPLLAQAALRGPDERPLGRQAVALLIVAYATSLGMLGLATAAVYDPLAQGCLDCPTNHFLVTSDAERWHELGQLGLVLSVVWTDAFALLACARLARLSPAGRRVAAPVLVHRRGLLDDPGFAQEIASAARLAIEHERLHASRRAQLERLRLSRARLVATADAERRQLERDLHDGAQQRLLTLSITVRLARRQLGGRDPALERELAAAEDELAVALAELRELAHGLFPMVLSNEGLGAALEVLAERTPRLLTGALPDGRFAAPVESAAYFVVSEAVQRGPSGDVTVDVRRDGDRLLVEVHAEAELTGEATAIEDRVGALGGALVADVHHLRAELPCAS